MRTTALAIAAVAALVAGVPTARWGRAAEPLPKSIRRGLETIQAETLLGNIKILASDEFEGRAPASPGEEKTVAWLIDQFKALGLAPGNPNGTWVQEVPMVGSTALDPKITCETQGQQISPVFPDECVIWTKRRVTDVRVEGSEVVFAGYGVVAPEYNWDDYKEVDVRGKTLLILINDPQIPDPKDADRLDPAMFKGRAMTYYGRWTYKFEEAARKGAAAAILVHEEALAGYPWRVVVDSNSRENFDLATPDGNAGRARIEGWMTLEQARKICAAAGFDFEALKRNALNKEFKPLSLPIKAGLSLKNELRKVTSRNVIARLEGSGRRLRNEHVVYTAHWDHLGRDPKLAGDPVYHGALDNASGVAGLIELARAFKALPSPPKRSVLFLSVTAEEKGLLGARYYAENPLHPLATTVANLNMDGLNAWGRTADLEIIGAGNSTLEDLLAQSAAAQGRVTKPESRPDRGSFYRSDHFEFARAGVPALYFKAGTNYIGKPADYGARKVEEFVSHDYHKPSDNVRADWDIAGAVEDLRLLFHTGWTVAETDARPGWKPESEFSRKGGRGAGGR